MSAPGQASIFDPAMLMEDVIFKARTNAAYKRFETVQTSYRKLLAQLARNLLSIAEGPRWNDPNTAHMGALEPVNCEAVQTHAAWVREITEMLADERQLAEASEAEVKLRARAREGAT